MATIPTTAANAKSRTRTPPIRNALSFVPNVEVAQSFTGSGVLPITHCPTATTGEACGLVSPAISWATPIATAAVIRPAIAPVHALGRPALGLAPLVIKGKSVFSRNPLHQSHYLRARMTCGLRDAPGNG